MGRPSLPVAAACSLAAHLLLTSLLALAVREQAPDLAAAVPVTMVFAPADPAPQAAPAESAPTPSAPEPVRDAEPAPAASAVPAPAPPVSPTPPPDPLPATTPPTPNEMTAAPPAPPAPSAPAPPKPPPARPKPAPRPALPHAAAPSRALPPGPPPSVATAPAQAALPVSPPTAATAGEVDAGWRGALVAWLQSRKSYPDEARRHAEEGTVVLRFTVGRDGTVLSVVMARPSGSPTLDAAAQAILRGARLPSFPASMSVSEVTVTIPIRYRLEQ